MPQSSAPTLLVFTLGAARESARRRLAPAGLQGMETALRQACFDAALAAGRACGCRLAVCREVVRLAPLAGLDRPADLARLLADRGSGKGRARRRPPRAAAAAKTAAPEPAAKTPAAPEPVAATVQPYADLLRRALA